MYTVWHIDKYKITFKFVINWTNEILQHIVVSSGLSRPGKIDARARRLRNTALKDTSKKPIIFQPVVSTTSKRKTTFQCISPQLFCPASGASRLHVLVTYAVIDASLLVSNIATAVGIDEPLFEVPPLCRTPRQSALVYRVASIRVVNATPRPLYPRERPGTHCTGGWVSLNAGLDRCGKSRPHRDSIPVYRDILVQLSLLVSRGSPETSRHNTMVST